MGGLAGMCARAGDAPAAQPETGNDEPAGQPTTAS